MATTVSPDSVRDHLRALLPEARGDRHTTLKAALGNRRLRIHDGQFVIYRDAGTYHLLPAASADIVHPIALSRLPSLDAAKAFATRLITLMEQPPLGNGLSWSSPALAQDLQDWQGEYGESNQALNLIWLRARALFDRETGHRDSEANREYESYEPLSETPAPPEGHAWAFQLEPGDWVLLDEFDREGERGYQPVQDRHVGDGLVTLTVADRELTLPRNTAVPRHQAEQEVWNSSGDTVIAHWIRAAEVQNSEWVGLPAGGEVTSRLPRRLFLSGAPGLALLGRVIEVERDDYGDYQVRLAQARAIDDDGNAFTVPFAEDEVWELPPRLWRLTPHSARAETSRDVQLSPRERMDKPPTPAASGTPQPQQETLPSAGEDTADVLSPSSAETTGDEQSPLPEGSEEARPYRYPSEAATDWERVVDAFTTLNDHHHRWPGTRSKYNIVPDKARRHVELLRKQIPPTPQRLAEAAYQLDQLSWIVPGLAEEIRRTPDEALRALLTPHVTDLAACIPRTLERTRTTDQQSSQAGSHLRHPWLTNPPEGVRPVGELQGAATPERPGRLLHPDGTQLRCLGIDEEAAEQDAVSVGAVPSPRGQGSWQAIRFPDGTHAVVHPALLHPAGHDPYPKPDNSTLERDMWVARWHVFDRSEAAGESTAALPARFLEPGDEITVPGHKRARTVTRIEKNATGHLKRRRVTGGIGVWHIGAGGGQEKRHFGEDRLTEFATSRPARHPALNPPTPGEPGGTLQNAASPSQSQLTPAAPPDRDPGSAPAKDESPLRTPALATSLSPPAGSGGDFAEDGPAQSATPRPASASADRAATPRPAPAPAPSLPQDPAPLTAYADPAAFDTAHERLRRAVDQHRAWLSSGPTLGQATAHFDTSGPWGLSTLQALLELESVASASPKGRYPGDSREAFLEELRRHLRRTQLTMAQEAIRRAEAADSEDALRGLETLASRGQFITLTLPTGAGDMTVEQYLRYRLEALQTATDDEPTEESPGTTAADEEPSVEAGTDDDMLPVLEIPGMSIGRTTDEAAPPLFDKAQSDLAAGAGATTGTQIFAHVYGRPLYGHVTEPAQGQNASARTLHLEISPGQDPQVHINSSELAEDGPEVFLTRLLAWLDVADQGKGGALRGYGRGTAVTPTPTPTPEEATNMQTGGAPTPEAQARPRSSAPTSDDPPGRATRPDHRAQEQPTLMGTAVPSTSDGTPPDPAEAPPPAATVITAAQSTAPATPEGTTHRSTPPNQKTVPPAPPGPTGTAAHDGSSRAELVGKEPIDRLLHYARNALTSINVEADLAAHRSAPGQIAITYESSGDETHDREIASRLRTAVNEQIGQHADDELGVYRLDFYPTSQAGQPALPTTTADTPATRGPGADHPKPSSPPEPGNPDTARTPHRAATPGAGTPRRVPRERLLAANAEAAKIFAERLQTDPTPEAERARTYLRDERQVPADLQQRWIIGYTPPYKLVTELRRKGFTDDELIQAGLAQRGESGLYDFFRDRIMFPIHDANRDIVGFGARRIDEPGESDEEAHDRAGPKYINTGNNDIFTKGEHVFGLYHPAQQEAGGDVISVEGYTDVIATACAVETIPPERRPIAGAAMGTAIPSTVLNHLRGRDASRPLLMFVDNDLSGRKVLLDKWEDLVQIREGVNVTTAPGAKDAAQLRQDGIKDSHDGVTPILKVLEQHQPLLDATVDTALTRFANKDERAAHAFGDKDDSTQRAAVDRASRYIREHAHIHAPTDTAHLKHQALTWAKQLHQSWNLAGPLTAAAILHDPDNPEHDYNQAYQDALDLLATDRYFDDNPLVQTRAAHAPAEDTTMTTPPTDTPAATDPMGLSTHSPGSWPAGTGLRTASPPAALPAAPAPPSARSTLPFTMTIDPPSPDGSTRTLNDRTHAAYQLHTDLRERLVQHTSEPEHPTLLPTPRRLATIHGIPLATSGDDPDSEDPTLVIWLGDPPADPLRLSHSRLTELTPAALLAVIEWRAAHTAGLLGEPLSPTWRDAVRTIFPAIYPAHPTPAQLDDLLSTLTEGTADKDIPDRIRSLAEQALFLYTEGHPDMALKHLSNPGHEWELRDDGTWIEKATTDGPDPAWPPVREEIRKQNQALSDIRAEAAALPPGDPATPEPPAAADLTAIHHTAHQALAALHPYSIGLPDTTYDDLTELVRLMPADNSGRWRLPGPEGERLMSRARAAGVRVLEVLATVASKLRLTQISAFLERRVAKHRGEDLTNRPAAKPLVIDRRLQDLAHIERDLERRMTSAQLDQLGELQERWIVNHARWRDRYQQLHGQPPEADFLPDNGLIAGAPPIPNLVRAHDRVVKHLKERVAALRDGSPHTEETGDPDDPTAALYNGVATAYRQRLVGTPPTGDAPAAPIPTDQLREAAHKVIAHDSASPLIVRRALKVSAEQADRILHRLEAQQILAPYNTDRPRTVVARREDVDTLLAQPPEHPSGPPRSPGTSQHAAASQVPNQAGDHSLTERQVDLPMFSQWVDKFLDSQRERSRLARTSPSTGPGRQTSPARSDTRSSEAQDNARAAHQPASPAPTQH